MTATLQLLRELKLDGMRLSLEALRDMGDSSLAGLMPILGRLVEAEAEQRRQVKCFLSSKIPGIRHIGFPENATGNSRLSP
jgi:hypothetical protein